MQVAYETTTVQPPKEARNTDITTYMWPGYLGEWDAETHEFRAWKLVSSNYWIPAPDIKVPPMKCIGILTEPTWVWTLSTSAGTEYHSQAGSTHRILAASPPALLVR